MKEAVLVLGSGPIRIGQGIEFDYSCVHCVWALQQLGYRALIINNNPETVSTDFDTGDGLYFEPVTLEDVLRVVRHENAAGVIVQFGGQTAINLAAGLAAAGIQIFGTPSSAIDLAEDRDLFEKLLRELDIPKPNGRAVNSLEAAREVAAEVGYPVLVRPSFVLGGRAMEIVHSEPTLEHFYREAESVSPGQPVLVDAYLQGVEAEVDAICDGRDVFVPGIMEHIERAGVHSGDSMAVFPPVSLSAELQERMVGDAIKIGRAMGIRGLMNIQFVIHDGVAYVIEVNPRASRTVPVLSKVTGIPVVQLGTHCAMGRSLASLGYRSGLWQLDRSASLDGFSEECRPAANGVIVSESDFRILPSVLYAVKAPVFSFQKLTRVEPSLGPEMKSTGEVMGLDEEFEAALYKALVGSGIQFRSNGLVVLTVTDADKLGAVEVARELVRQGYPIGATGGTHDFLLEHHIRSQRVNKIREGSPSLLDMIAGGEISLMINTPGANQDMSHEAARIRRACIESGVACVTNIDTAKALARALRYFEKPELASCRPFMEYVRG